MAKEQCGECNREFNSKISLARHLTQMHSMTTKQYYDKFLKSNGDGICNCGSSTRFVNINTGYQKVCGHSCAAVKFRAEQKADYDRNLKFTNNISVSQTSVWKNRTLEQKQAISEKIVNTPGWKCRVPGKILSSIQMNLLKESIGKKDCKMFGIDLIKEISAWDLSQIVIKSITDFGVFVGLAAGIDGLVHLSDLSWNETGEAAVREFNPVPRNQGVNQNLEFALEMDHG